MDRGVVELVLLALKASVYLAPKEPGLTYDELIAVCESMGLKAGEVGDSLQHSDIERYFNSPHILPKIDTFDVDFLNSDSLSLRNVDAFQFARATLREVARQMGKRNASIDRSVLIERGVSAGISEHDLEAAVTMLVMSKMLKADEDDEGKLTLGQYDTHAMPHDQMKQASELKYDVDRSIKASTKKLIAAVKDTVARRADGRPSSARALDAFAEALDAMGFANFRLWWAQTVSEMKQLDPVHTPVAVAVAAAALVEGSLTFAAKYARTDGLDAFKSSDYDKDPRTWKIDDLVKSAASGGQNAVLDAGARHQADELIKVRQRIHAGRMLSDHPAGVPDLRPEEASAAKATAEKIVRCVLDWLSKNRPSST